MNSHTTKGSPRERRASEKAGRDAPDPACGHVRGFVLLDPAGVIRQISASAATFLCVATVHAVGLPFSAFVDRRDWRKFFAHLQDCQNKNGPRSVQVGLRSRNATSTMQLRSEPVIRKGMYGRCYRTTLVLESERPTKGDAERVVDSSFASPTAPSHTFSLGSPSPEGLAVSDQFLGTIAHELRNALAPMMMSLPVLKSMPAGSETAQRLHEIVERQVARMNRIVSDLLDLTRATHDKIRLEAHRLELNGLVRAVVDDHRAQFELRGVTLDVHGTAEPIYVVGDPVRLMQVLGNLLQNALKFTDRNGHVWAGVEVHERDAVLRVRDTGAGIAPESIARLFTPFAQAESTIDRNRSGLGLGLALVKRLIEMHGGTVSVTSAGLGRGAEFILRLPLAGQIGARQSGPRTRAHLSVA